MKLRPGRFSASWRAPVGTANLPPQSSTSVTRRYPTKSSNTGFVLADERTDTRACKLLEVAIKLRKRLCFCHPAGPHSCGATVEMTAFNGFRRGSDTTPVASVRLRTGYLEREFRGRKMFSKVAQSPGHKLAVVSVSRTSQLHFFVQVRQSQEPPVFPKEAANNIGENGGFLRLSNLHKEMKL